MNRSMGIRTVLFFPVLIFGLSISVSSQLIAQTISPSKSPCKQSPILEQFDFWIGHWEVTLGDGTVVGVNSINREQNGCVLIENWKGVQGGSGISINYFDQAKAKWVQIWTGSQGSQIQIEGGLLGESMVLVGKLATLGQTGNTDFRGTWTPLADGRVRQFFEQSNDGGESWQPWFEGYYRRITTD